MSEKKYPINMEKNDIKFGQLWARYSVVVNKEDVGVYRIDFDGLKKVVAEVLKYLNISQEDQEVATISDYEAAFADHRHLVREIDVIMNGENAAKQATLGDILWQIKRDWPKKQGVAKASIAKVLEWAGTFYGENGDQLMLDDNEWYVTMEDEDEIGTRNCKSVTADDLAELYLMHHPDESAAEQPVVDNYDTLYYMVLPVLHKLRHRTDNDTRMLVMAVDIRNTIQNAIAEIKKLPQPKSANDPPYLVQSAAAEQPIREESDGVAFDKWCKDQQKYDFILNAWRCRVTGEKYTWGQMYEIWKSQQPGREADARDFAEWLRLNWKASQNGWVDALGKWETTHGLYILFKEKSAASGEKEVKP